MTGPEDSLEPSFQALRRAEDRHFWFRARNRLLARALETATRGMAPGFRVLEAGCGTGNTLRVLAALPGAGLAVGLDLFETGVRLARERVGASLLQADLRRLPLKPAFDLACAFDVIEHLDDDEGALAVLAAAVRPGGKVAVTVPADPALWSFVDEAAGHARRYTASGLAAKAARSGLAVERITHFMAPLVPLVWVARMARAGRKAAGMSLEEKRALAEEELSVPGWANRLLYAVLAREADAVGRGLQLPIGTSLLLVGRREA